jgi:NADP-dependent 3-hydroxy acid dehydrogenase YdfG
MQLTGARVWLTGASSGIGEALADALAGQGARLAISARREDALRTIAARHPAGEIRVVPADVSDRASVHTAARAVLDAWQAVDLAIFNAGVGRPITVDTLAAADFHYLMNTNFFGVLYGVEAVLPSMLERRAGRIAVVASLAGYRGGPGLAGYGTTKAALIHLFDSLRFPLAPRGVGVTLINPGYVRTPMTAKNTFRMPALMDAPVAAAIIVRGLRGDRREIHFPARFSWPVKLLRVLPYPVYEAVMRAAVKVAHVR